MATPPRPSPIAILSFDRPDYLSQVVDSLLAQRGGRIDDREIVLFQDGAQSRTGGVPSAREVDLDASVAVFRTKLPGRRVVRSAVNLGVALNFDRAERFMFEDRGADAAIFLEDDMVLAPLYLQVMERLIDLARYDERIGYVGAYGHHFMPRAVQLREPARYTPLEHNWAFGLLRRQWLRNRPFLDKYLDLVRDVDYRRRPTREIHRLFHSWGMGCGADSQDATKGLACCATGAARLNTTIVLGRYIGEHGLHMHPAEFARQGYGDTEMYDGPLPDFRPLTAEAYERIFGAQSRWSVGSPCHLG